jgi:L-seryl-tRNA(Ser) seleniumtransferase
MARSLTLPGGVFERLGTRPVINACGIYTDLGGARLSPGVIAAMVESNRSFVRMPELLESSGQIIAERLGAEAARVTPGAAASIALMVAAAMVGLDGAAGERLPDTEGVANEILLQRNHRYKYDRQIRLTGAKIVAVGSERGTSPAELEAAITARSAAIFVPAHLDGQGGTSRLDAVVAIARRANLPVLVDAAYLCWPLETMAALVGSGADLVCFSAKYFGGPNAGGFIAGSRRMIDAVTANNFIRYESGPYRTFGRPFKLDRQTIAAVVTALLEWLDQDHAARWSRYATWADRLRAKLAGIPGLRATPMGFTMDEQLVSSPVNALVVDWGLPEPSAADVAARLLAADPSIACVAEPNRLVFCFDVMAEAEVDLVGDGLRAALDR